MKKLFAFVLIFVFAFTFSVTAQFDTLTVPYKHDVISLGPGMGLDYGGFGLNLTIYPQRNIGIFGGGGYALVGFGYNIGAKIRFVSESTFKRYTFYLTGMYGYNAAIMVTNASQYNKIFYGPSFGLGLDYKTSAGRNGYWTMALLIPVRSPEVQEYLDDLENNHGVELKSGLIPVAFSIGYRFIIQ